MIIGFIGTFYYSVIRCFAADDTGKEIGCIKSVALNP